VCLLSPTGQLGVGHKVVAAAAAAGVLPGCAGLRALPGGIAGDRGFECARPRISSMHALCAAAVPSCLHVLWPALLDMCS
jgi:hypothetical protein